MTHATLARLVDIAYHLPEQTLDNTALVAEFSEWTDEKIREKTGIVSRRIARADECSSDLAVKAAEKLFSQGACKPDDVDYTLVCTQSPDYLLPTTACLIQDRLGIPKSSGAFDFNLGCSGYVVGLGIAKGLIETSQARNVLLLTAETYSRFMHPKDKSVRSLFGDAAAATLISQHDGDTPYIGPFVNGTDGSGAQHLIVPAGGMRKPHTPETAIATERESGNVRSEDNLYMNGSEIFTFTLRVIPRVFQALLDRAELTIEQLDLVVFHQANTYMLEHLRRKIGIPKEKFVIALRDYGNTVSSTIPIALAEARAEGRICPGSRIALLGFGVGYSWSGTILRWC